MPVGRPPKPTLVKLAEGDAGKRGKRKLEEKAASEPQPVRGLPARPSHLNPDAAEAWDFLSAQLEAMQLDSMPDAYALECACVAFATFRRAQRILDRRGLTHKIGANGYRQQRPEVAIAAGARKEFREFCSHFGLTPAARTKIAAGSGEDMELKRIEEALSKPRQRVG